jgi:1-acyl-sn-glycerol-3-phosphate acyltransferase
MSFLWFPINLLQVIFVTVWSVFCTTAGIVMAKIAGNPRPGLWVARKWAPVVLASGWVRLQIEGRERLDPSKAYFIVSNHLSWVDIPILLASLPIPVLFIAKQELKGIPLLKHYAETMGMVFVNRSDRRDSMRSVEVVTERLRAGWSVLAFPEGTRSVDGRLLRFRGATFAAAIEAGVQVLPIALENPARIVPRKGIRFRPGLVRVAFGEPLSTAEFSRDDRVALATRAQQAVAAELARLRGLSGPEEVVAEPLVPA